MQFRMQWSEPPKFETQNPYEKKTDASKTQLSRDNLQCKVPAGAKSTHPKYNLKGTVHKLQAYMEKFERKEER